LLQGLNNIFRIPELRKRIFYTLALIVVYRVGGHIPTPGVNTTALSTYFNNPGGGGLFGIFDLFAGGALQRATIFALGIMPYISASIILQLLGAVIPYYQKLQKLGEEGRKKITQHTRYFTVLIGLGQSFGISIWLTSLETSAGLVVPEPGFFFTLMTMITFTAGTIFIMWLGEQITERGIGNGISLIIMIGIVARFPNAVFAEFSRLSATSSDKIAPITALFLIALFIGVIAAVVVLTEGTRKIPVQYAKRVVGRKVFGMQNTYIPLKVNTSGVIPIIFAQSIMFFPQTIASFAPDIGFIQDFTAWFDVSHWFYWLVSSGMIVFFAYFYTAIVFNPVDLAENMKRYGGFIPGVRPGKKTAEYIDFVLTRITLPGSLALALVYIFPYMIMNWMNISYSFAAFFGGTGLLIVVGVALDTLQQIESHLTMRHYDTFMKSGKIRGRRG